jgi:hypothetical protein
MPMEPPIAEAPEDEQGEATVTNPVPETDGPPPKPEGPHTGTEQAARNRELESPG